MISNQKVALGSKKFGDPCSTVELAEKIKNGFLSLGEHSNDQFRVVHEMSELDSRQMRKNKKLPLGWQCIWFAQDLKKGWKGRFD